MLQQSGNIQYIAKDLRIHEKLLNSCSWSGDGKYLGACFTDRLVKICQLESSGTVRAIQTIPCGHSVKRLVWNPADNQRFAIAGSDKCIEMWDVRAPRAASKIPSAYENVDISWSPNGAYIVTGTYSNQLCVYDVRGTKLLKKAHLLYEVSGESRRTVIQCESSHSKGLCSVSMHGMKRASTNRKIIAKASVN